MAFPAALLWPPTPQRHHRPTAIGFISIDVISSLILRICRPTLKDPIHDACAILMYDLDLWQRSELIVVILHFDKPQVSVCTAVSYITPGDAELSQETTKQRIALSAKPWSGINPDATDATCHRPFACQALSHQQFSVSANHRLIRLARGDGLT